MQMVFCIYVTVFVPYLICIVSRFFFFFFCIKMKSETQNIYNFSMERKNVKETIRKWKLFFIVLAKNKQKNASGESYKNTILQL